MASPDRGQRTKSHFGPCQTTRAFGLVLVKGSLGEAHFRINGPFPVSRALWPPPGHLRLRIGVHAALLVPAASTRMSQPSLVCRCSLVLLISDWMDNGCYQVRELRVALYVHNNTESRFYTVCVFIQAAKLKILGNGEFKASMLKADIVFRFYENNTSS